MAKVELIMPKMGESIMEATILKWAKKVGDTVDVDETILEIATDKVDSEIPSPVAGTLVEILFQENDVVEVGRVIAHIEVEGEAADAQPSPSIGARIDTPVETPAPTASETPEDRPAPSPDPTPADMPDPVPAEVSVAAKVERIGATGRFYSPLVRNIAKAENISMHELERVPGTGAKGRVTKKDMLQYLKNRTGVAANGAPSVNQPSTGQQPAAITSSSGSVDIVEMDRMRKLIADHMVQSKRTSPHVTSFVEVDVTNVVNWRNAHKAAFQQKHGQKITFTPIFAQAVVRAIQDFPMINVSVDDNRILVKRDIHVGMATALPSGNLIVPVIKHADRLNLVGLTMQVNDLASRARNNQLKPDEIQGGTFTLTNVGTFGNVMGTPIINQPQVAILATGAIRKKPAVLETEHGDVIAIRQMMFLSLSYDHRVVDGFLGGSFLRRVGDYLEQFDMSQGI